MTDMATAFTQAMSRPSILCDIDNTLNFQTEIVFPMLNARFGLDLLAFKQTSYRYVDGLTADQAAWLKAQMADASNTMYLNVSPDFNAINALGAFKAAGFHVVVATNRNPRLTSVTAQWVNQWDVPHDELLVGPDEKVNYVTANPNTVAIDDDPAKALLLPPLGATLWIPKRPYTPTWVDMIGDVHVFTQWSQVLTALGVEVSGSSN